MACWHGRVAHRILAARRCSLVRRATPISLAKVGDNDRDRPRPPATAPMRGCLTNELSRFRPTWQCPSLSFERRDRRAVPFKSDPFVMTARGKDLVREAEKTLHIVWGTHRGTAHSLFTSFQLRPRLEARDKTSGRNAMLDGSTLSSSKVDKFSLRLYSRSRQD